MLIRDVPSGVTQENQEWWRLVFTELGDAAVKVDGSEALQRAAAAGVDVAGVGAGDVVGFAFKDLGRAMLSIRANLEAFGHPALAVLDVEGAEGYLVVLDLRPSMLRLAADSAGEGLA